MRLEDLETSCRKLPTFPVVAVKVLKAIKKDAFTIEEVSNIISTDIALTAKILRAANSAFYGRTTPVKTVSDAFMVIGLETAKNLALSFSLIEILTIKDSDFDFEFFWKNSITAGIAAEFLSKMLGYPKNNEYFSLGFLQDIGILILYNYDPATYTKILEEKKTGDKLYLIEQKVIGLDHQEAGSYILKIWDFPESIYLPISTHHNPQALMNMAEDIAMATNILNIADLVRDIYYGSKKSRKIAELYNICIEKFSLEAEDIDSFMDTVGKETMNILEFFEIDAAGTKSYTEILKEENQALMRINMEYKHTMNEDSNNDKDEAEEDIRQLVMTNERLREAVLEQNAENKKLTLT